MKSSAKWQTLHADPNGKVNLAAVLPASGSAIYARAYVFSPKKQSATITASGENPLRVWVNEESSYSRASAGSSRDASFEVELKKGWNVLLVKLTNAGKPALFGVRITGDGLQTAGTPSELPVSAEGRP